MWAGLSLTDAKKRTVCSRCGSPDRHGYRNRIPRELPALLRAMVTAEGPAILAALVSATRRGDARAAAVALDREPRG